MEQLHQSIFPNLAPDRLSNYNHVRLLNTMSSTHQDRMTTISEIVLPVSGPTFRRSGFEQCLLKWILVPNDEQHLLHSNVLKEVIMHRAVTAGKDPMKENVLPLVSHFVSSTTFVPTTRGRVHRSTKKTYLFLILPYCEGDNLSYFLTMLRSRVTNIAPITTTTSASPPSQTRPNRLSESELRWILDQLLVALQRCHSRGIVHGDLQTSNILICCTKARGSRLLLSNFGKSQWMEEEESSDENLESDNRVKVHSHENSNNALRNSPQSDFQSLACLCCDLLTGKQALTSAAMLSSSGSESDGCRLKIAGDRSITKTNINLPNSLSMECNDLLRTLLQRPKQRRIRSASDILAHPFMDKSRARSALSFQLKPRSSSKTEPHPQPPLEFSNVSIGSAAGEKSGSTTLQSVMERLNPNLFLTACESKMQMIKTPFGVVQMGRCHKTRGRDSTTFTSLNAADSEMLSWGDGYGTRGLMAVRQRIKGGKIELNGVGEVILTSASTIVISSNGAHLQPVWSRESELPTNEQRKELFGIAARWLSRYRSRTTIATFLLSSYPTGKASSMHVVKDAPAYCSIRANGPLPDYKIHLRTLLIDSTPATEERGTCHHTTEVLVQRKQSRLKFESGMLWNGKQKRGKRNLKFELPIVVTHRQWSLWHTSTTSLLVQELSAREQTAIERALRTSDLVDVIFDATFSTRDT